MLMNLHNPLNPPFIRGTSGIRLLNIRTVCLRLPGRHPDQKIQQGDHGDEGHRIKIGREGDGQEIVYSLDPKGSGKGKDAEKVEAGMGHHGREYGTGPHHKPAEEDADHDDFRKGPRVQMKEREPQASADNGKPPALPVQEDVENETAKHDLLADAGQEDNGQKRKDQFHCAGRKHQFGIHASQTIQDEIGHGENSLDYRADKEGTDAQGDSDQQGHNHDRNSDWPQMKHLAKWPSASVSEPERRRQDERHLRDNQADSEVSGLQEDAGADHQQETEKIQPYGPYQRKWFAAQRLFQNGFGFGSQGWLRGDGHCPPSRMLPGDGSLAHLVSMIPIRLQISCLAEAERGFLLVCVWTDFFEGTSVASMRQEFGGRVTSPGTSTSTCIGSGMHTEKRKQAGAQATTDPGDNPR